MDMWKGNGNTTTLFFSLKGLKILHQERRGQVKTIVMEHFNGILFHKFGPARKQHTNHSLINDKQCTILVEYIKHQTSKKRHLINDLDCALYRPKCETR